MFDPVRSLNVSLAGQHIGRLALTPERRVAFQYESPFLTSGYSISPFFLPLDSELRLGPFEPFDGNFGVFNDSLPDGWGSLLLDRYLKQQGVALKSLTVLDRLSLVGAAGMGALEYYPDHRIRTETGQDDLSMLARQVALILSESATTSDLAYLIQEGGSAGGARPKILLQRESRSWLVKFPASTDSAEIGSIEYETAEIARRCGIQMPETRLFEGKYFAIERFDRQVDRKVHMASASGILHASHRFPSLDYVDLIKATHILTKNLQEAYKLFRLMVFNVVIGNKDDHAKNFSFLHDHNEWALSPGYDLVPSQGFNSYHTTTIAGFGAPDLPLIYEAGIQGGLEMKQMKSIVDEVMDNARSIAAVDW
jgi:serine/threonine-protein kinase HipA